MLRELAFEALAVGVGQGPDVCLSRVERGAT
jgi:hypothetical protein